ncbi:ATP-binding protein [Brevibacillus laterosporus]|uniref:ATP-binding protein n=1 Tax=Brevibacillus laterosporus TaxID=1465 RepID=UPI003D21B2CD
MQTELATFSFLMNQVKDIIFLIKVTADRQFVVLQVNEAFLEATGYEYDEVVGKPIQASFKEEAMLFSVDKCFEAVQQQSTVEYEESLNAPLGTSTYEIALHPIQHANSTQFVVGIVRNITERKLVEEKQCKSEKLWVVGQLSAAIAHELRNPLTSLKGFLKLMEKQMENRDERIQKYLQIMGGEFERIEQIVDGFMQLSLPEPIQRDYLYLPSLVEEAIELFYEENQSLFLEIHIEFHFYGEIPLISCDRDLMKRVLLHLFMNAAESMPGGGDIFLTVYVNELEVCIAIVDEGIGIEEERLHRLGEPFYSTKEKGTGLGLTMCYQVVKQHQGRIMIHSQENEGTIVTVALPIHPF